MNDDKTFKLFKSFSDELDLEKLQLKFLNALLSLQNVERGSIWIKTDSGYLCVEAVGPQSDDIKGVSIKSDQSSIVGWVIENGKMAIADPQKDERHYSALEKNLRVKSQLIVTFPLLLKENKVYGVVQLIDTRLENNKINIEQEYLNYLQNLVDTGAVALGNAIAYTQQKNEAQYLKQTLREIRSDGTMVGQELVFIEAMEMARRYSNSDFPVLITGESGTGKELMAERIHQLSDRAEKPFLVQNCSTIPETLLESELFGYKKGAFSGATKDRLGLFEAADGGTVFLDEIGDMPVTLQARILRVAQNSEIKPIGSTSVKKVDIRIISATNVDIQKAIEKEEFRSDLFYRLSVLPLSLPSLRARKNDIPLLMNHFLKRESLRLDVTSKVISDDAMHLLMNYKWPGNIRELENLIRYLLVSSADEVIHAVHLPQNIIARPVSLTDESVMGIRAGITSGSDSPAQNNSDIFGDMSWEDVEKKYAVHVLTKNNWNVTRAAEFAGVNRSTFASRIRKLGITKDV